MNDYYECYNFFKECSAFVIKHKNFITACKRIRDNNGKLDPKMYDAFVSDISDIEESDDSDQSENEDDEMDDSDTNSSDESENEVDESESDEEDNNSEDEMEYDDDMADLFETEQCCIHELLKPFMKQ